MKKNNQGFAHMALLGLVAITLIVSVGIYVSKNNKKTTNKELDKTNSSLVSPLPSDLLSVDKVKEFATQDSSTANVTSIELEQEHGTYLYKVKLSDGTILFFDAKTGAKVTHDPGEKETEDGNIPSGFVPAISFDKAREIALSKKPGGVISKIELESEEGKVVYSVRFSDEARIDIDANTGEVVKTRTSTKTTNMANSVPKNEDDSSNETSESETSDSNSSEDDTDDSSSHGGSSGNSGSNKDTNKN